MPVSWTSSTSNRWDEVSTAREDGRTVITQWMAAPPPCNHDGSGGPCQPGLKTGMHLVGRWFPVADGGNGPRGSAHRLLKPQLLQL